METDEKPGIISYEYTYFLYPSYCELPFKTKVCSKSWLIGRKKTPLAKVFTTMKKREASFKSELWESIKSLLVCLLLQPFLLCKSIKITRGLVYFLTAWAFMYTSSITLLFAVA